MKNKMIENLLKPRQPKYKQVKRMAPFCPVCNEELRGDNSINTPYRCSCGGWEGNWINPGYYTIKIPRN